jgi:hypothetical protein
LENLATHNRLDHDASGESVCVRSADDELNSTARNFCWPDRFRESGIPAAIIPDLGLCCRFTPPHFIFVFACQKFRFAGSNNVFVNAIPLWWSWLTHQWTKNLDPARL